MYDGMWTHNTDIALLKDMGLKKMYIRTISVATMNKSDGGWLCS